MARSRQKSNAQSSKRTISQVGVLGLRAKALVPIPALTFLRDHQLITPCLVRKEGFGEEGAVGGRRTEKVTE
jgi:hypothetical protein